MQERPGIREFFDRLAARYAADRYGPAAGRFRAYFFGERLRHVRDLLGDVRGRLLDLGSGPGILDPLLPATGVERISLDLSLSMLAEVTGPAVAGDAESLPIRDGTMDVVVALGLTTYLGRLDRLFSEVARVLRPGGRFLVSFTRRAAPDTIVRGLARGILRHTRDLFPGRPGVLSSGLAVRTHSTGEIRRAFARWGFSPVDRRLHNFTVFPASVLLPGPSVRLSERLERRERAPSWLASDELVLAEKRKAAGAARSTPIRRAPTRIVRVIARLNVGGPARHVILLGKHLDPARYTTTLVTGSVEAHEGDMRSAARRAGVDPVIVPGLGRSVSPTSDLRAFVHLLRIFLRERPRIVHTHTAKAGTLGRLAAWLAGVPVRIHTFHGHVLHGYFSPRASRVVKLVERVLARITTRVVAISEEVKRDLCERYRVVPAAKVVVVPLGLDLAPFAERRDTSAGGRGTPTGPGARGIREELGIPAAAPVVTMVGRVTAIKEPLDFVRVAILVRKRIPEAVFLLAGGGELLSRVREECDRANLGEGLRLLGWREDLPELLAGTDLAVLTSRSEGTPVALIEAAAAGVPAVATRVGGVPSVVRDGITGVLVPPSDPERMAAEVVRLLEDRERRRAMGEAARDHVLSRFGVARLVENLSNLYESTAQGR